MPVNLGALPSNAPLKTGGGQRMTGVQGSASQTTYNNTIPAGTVLRASPGGATMQIAMTPTDACWWKVSAQTLWISPDPQWTRADWRIVLLVNGSYGSDLDGQTQAYGMARMHSATSFITSFAEMTYRLAAGNAYTARLEWMGSPFGFNQNHWHDGNYNNIHGARVGETVQ